MKVLTPGARELVAGGFDDFRKRWEAASPAERARLVADARRIERATTYPSPVDLATHLDPKFIVTPALALIDARLRQVAEAVEVMYERRARHHALLVAGVDDAVAVERATAEVEQRGVTRLIISMPPQEGKSTLVSRYGVEWVLRRFPGLRVTLVSYDGVNASRISYQIRSDVELFDGSSDNPDLGLRLMANQKAMGRWMLDSGGGVYAIGVGGGLTGHPSDYGLIDDPLKDIRAADSVIQAKAQMEWWQTTMRPRLAPWAPVVIVTTRWAENDLPGQLLEKRDQDRSSGAPDFDDWVVVNIPAQANHDPDAGGVDLLGREPGEFMVSARGRTVTDWEATKGATPQRFWQALYQGDPTPVEGNILRRAWWRRYDTPLWTRTLDGTYLVRGHTLTQSWDFTFKDLATSDYVVGQVWAKKGADSYLLYQVRARLSFTDTLSAIRRVSTLFPGATLKLYEDTANGPAIEASLRHEIPGLVAVSARGSKKSRAEAASPTIRAGNLHIPTLELATMQPDIAFDPDAFIEEATAFPYGTHDDQVDAMTQYVKERYLDHGTARIHSPVGRIPRSDVVADESEMARRLAARRASA